MVKLFGALSACAALLFLATTSAKAADDFEQDLLRKFQKQNQQGSLHVKQDIEKDIAEAFALSPQEPEKALVLLRHARELLDGADKLPKADRDALAGRLADGFRDATARIESTPAKNTTPLVPPPDDGPAIVFNPKITTIPTVVSTSVTPTVSADRRWVRLSFSGSFSITSVRMFPVQIPVPTILQGPGRGFTVVR
jgi:hypothetical protein